MLDPALCNRPVSQWLLLKSMLSTWLTTPILVVLPLIALILIPWIMPRLRWKRQISGLGSALLVSYFIATLPITMTVASKGLVAFIPQDPGVKADAIVVLGRGGEFRQSRVEVAAQLWKARRAPMIFASGSGDGTQIVHMLKAEGIPESALGEESCSRTTEENALFTASVLQPQVKRVLLVTDPPHILRSLLTFRNLGFTVFPQTSSLPYLAPGKRAMMIFYEYAGLVSYGLKGYLNPQNIASEEKRQVAQTDKHLTMTLGRQSL